MMLALISQHQQANLILFKFYSEILVETEPFAG